MKDIVRDFFAGSLIIAAGFIASLLLLIILGVLWVVFHVLGAIFVAVFFVFLFFAAVWLVGFLYRKARKG